MENMDIFQAIILGLVQGVTEVLPISSSGHLVLVPWILTFEDPGLAFNVSLHLGTLFAIIYFFRQDWKKIIQGFISGTKKMKFSKQEERLPLFIVLATVPGVLAGYFLNDLAETAFRSSLLIAGTVFSFGLLLLVAEKRGIGKKGLENEDSKSGILTGIAQALAIVPGVSRSGITITAGMFQGFTRETAARFSFLISAPIILGAGVFEMKDMGTGDFLSEIFIAGFLTSTIASFLTIKFLMNFVQDHKLNIFAYYRFFLAFLILLIYFLRG